MTSEPIEYDCRGGGVVILCGTADAVMALRGVAEDLLVAGAELMSLSGVDADPSVLERALDDVDGAAVVVVCGHGDELAGLDLGARVDRRDAGHVLLAIDVDATRPASAAMQIAEAMMHLATRERHVDLGEVIAEVRADPDPISGMVEVPPPVAARPVAQPEAAVGRNSRRRLAPFVVAGAMLGAAAVVAIAVALDRGAPVADRSDGMIEIPPSPPAREPVLARAESRPARPIPPLRPAMQEAPRLEIAAQGPPPFTSASTPALASAIARGRVIAVDGIVAHVLEGERDWFHAMTTCRARAFWGLSGWRGPSTRELLALARTRGFGTATAWSSKRAGGEGGSAIVMALDSGATSKRPKTELGPITVCVRGAEREP